MTAFAELERVLKPRGVVLIADFMTENETQRSELVERFQREKRTDMLLEMDVEHLMDIGIAKRYLEWIGFEAIYESRSTLSWIFSAMRQKRENEGVAHIDGEGPWQGLRFRDCSRSMCARDLTIQPTAFHALPRTLLCGR
jgi:ubiquinone/menaquinone biosynthesis C-methylase UbiE